MMFAPASMRPALRRHGTALVVVALSAVLLATYRVSFVDPRDWAAACAPGATAPIACVPRAAVLWAQGHGLFGIAAIVLGLWSLRGARFPVVVLAVTVGIAGVVNYDATFGATGAALAAWAWLLDATDRA